MDWSGIGWLGSFSEFWLDWQFRGVLLSALILWMALGSGLRSPVMKFAVLAFGAWLLLILPLLLVLVPQVSLPVLPGIFTSQASALYQTLNILLLIAALMVSLMFVCRAAISAGKLIRLDRSKVPADDLAELFADCHRQIAPNKKVACFRSACADAPMTFGLINHRILLPLDSQTWDREQLRICLIHELCHIRRSDWLTQQVMMLAHLLNILNPLAWPLKNLLGSKMEESIDKICLHHGVNAQDYAQVLVGQARRSRERAGLFMPAYLGGHLFGKSAIQRRVGALIAEPYGWQAISSPHLWPTFVLMLLVAMGLSMIRLTEMPATSYSSFGRIPVVRLVPEEAVTDVDTWPSLQPVVHTNRALNPVGLPVNPPDSPDLETNLISINADWRTAETIAIPGQYRPGFKDIQIPREPLALELVAPEYPLREIQRGREGWVELEFDLDGTGVPVDIRVRENSGSGLFARAAIRALQNSRFETAPETSAELITRGLTQTYSFELLGSRERNPP